MPDTNEVIMEIQAISLQEKIQKLIDQYTEAKNRLSVLEQQVNELTEENVQLIGQIDSGNAGQALMQEQNRELEDKVKSLETKCAELQAAMDGFQDIATDAISKIDSIFPDLD